jgi:hypothetical protein
VKKLLFFLTVFSVSIFADQSELEYLKSVLPQDSILRASFVQTKEVRSLQNPLVSKGWVLVVKGRGIVWLTESPSYMKRVMEDTFFDGDFSKLQRRFNYELTKTESHWTLKLTPRAAALRRNFKYITIQSSLDNKLLEVLIFSTADSFVSINFVSEIPTSQSLTEDEEKLFEENY